MALFVLPRKEKTSEPDDEDLTAVFVAAAIIVVIVAPMTAEFDGGFGKS